MRRNPKRRRRSQSSKEDAAASRPALRREESLTQRELNYIPKISRRTTECSDSKSCGLPSPNLLGTLWTVVLMALWAEPCFLKTKCLQNRWTAF